MGRVAALLILASQILLLWVVFDPTGLPSIWFSFAGHPLVAAGVALGIWVLMRRLMGETEARKAAGREEP